MQKADDRVPWIKYDFDYLRRDAEVVFISCACCGRPIENKLGLCEVCCTEMRRGIYERKNISKTNDRKNLNSEKIEA